MSRRSNAPLVIVGSGHGGYQLARAFRRLDSTTPVVLVTADGGEDYPKPQFSHGLSRQLPAEALVNRSAREVAAELKIMVRPRTRIEAIDPDACTVHFDGKTLLYRDLVLAVGADPWRPQLEGDAAEQILTLNDLGDYRLYLERLSKAKRVLVIGGGLIGTEIAWDIADHGMEVHVSDVAPRLLANLLPAFAGERLQQVFNERGGRLHLEQGVQRLDRHGDAIRAQLANGNTVEVDQVICAAGLKPRLALARQAGLAVGQGIRVDGKLRTSAPHIYALGDCAEIEGRVLPYLQPITLSAQALAKTLAGTPTELRLPPMPTQVKTPGYPIQLSGEVGHPNLDWQIEQDEAGIIATAHRDGRMVGYVVTGERHQQGLGLLRQLAA